METETKPHRAWVRLDSEIGSSSTPCDFRTLRCLLKAQKATFTGVKVPLRFLLAFWSWLPAIYLVSNFLDRCVPFHGKETT